jgi:hypothetical protein
MIINLHQRKAIANRNLSSIMKCPPNLAKQRTMSRAKTIAFFAVVGPAVAAVPIMVVLLILAAYGRDPQGIGITAAAFLMAYVYGLIPAAVSGWLFSWLVKRRPWAVDRANSLAAMGLIAGFFTPLLVALPMCLIANYNTPGMRMIDGVGITALYLVFGSFSGAGCAILWRKCRATETKLPST